MAAVLRGLGKGIFLAKGLSFILRSQATILWWILQQEPVNPQGAKLSLGNLRTNARWLYDYLNLMRFENPAEFAVDAAGLGAGGGLRMLGKPFPTALAGAVGTRQWLKHLLGVETKTLFGIIPKPLVGAADTLFGVAQGGTALVLEGIDIAGGLATALSSGNAPALIRAVTRIPKFIERSIAFVTEAVTDLEAMGVAVKGLVEDIVETTQYYGGIVHAMLEIFPHAHARPSTFERFVYRTPAEILSDLMGPVGFTTVAPITGETRGPTPAEMLTGPARERVRQARERVGAREAAKMPTRRTIEGAQEIARLGVAFQQQQLAMTLEMVDRTVGPTMSLLSLLEGPITPDVRRKFLWLLQGGGRRARGFGGAGDGGDGGFDPDFPLPPR